MKLILGFFEMEFVHARVQVKTAVPSLMNTNKRKHQLVKQTQQQYSTNI